MTVFQLFGKIWEVAGMKVLVEVRPGVFDPQVNIRVAHVKTESSGMYREANETEMIGNYRAVVISAVSVREQ